MAVVVVAVSARLSRDCAQSPFDCLLKFEVFAGWLFISGCALPKGAGEEER